MLKPWWTAANLLKSNQRCNMFRTRILLPAIVLAAGLFLAGSTAEARPFYVRSVPCPVPVCAPAPVVVAAPYVVPAYHYRVVRHAYYHGYLGHRGRR
jgi:hypothetical protein